MRWLVKQTSSTGISSHALPFKCLFRCICLSSLFTHVIHCVANRFGGVDMEDIRGLRVPFLSTGWNRQFLMMREFGFVYDSSIAAPVSNPPIWPYTLDYKIPHKCIGNR